MSFICAECVGTKVINDRGVQSYRVCDQCGPGWFDHLARPIDMVDSPDGFTAGYAEVHDVTTYLNEEGVALVFYGDQEQPILLKFPFTWDEYRSFIHRGLEELKGGD